jgi:hypothetical protein
MADLFRCHGGRAAGDEDDEFDVFRPDNEKPYWCDVVASLGSRTFVVEILGFKGHNSGRAIRKDKNRENEIKALIYGIEFYSFWFWQLTPFNKETEELILEELGIK